MRVGGATLLALIATLLFTTAGCGHGASTGVTEPGAASCRTDADCRLFSDYCTGCDCRALATAAPDPACSGPGVQCLVDPCQGKSASCTNGACVVVR